MDTALAPDVKILDNLISKPDVALRSLYSSYYRFVCSVVYKMLGDGSMAEDISQEVFVEVWKRRETLDVNTSLKGYLRMIAVNKTLNHIRSKRMDFEQEEAILQEPSTDNSTQRVLEAEDLQKAINTAVDGLPERCRIIFGLSRYEEKSYREISAELEISIKTVENQISKALKLVRKAVLDFQDEKKNIFF
ncbi:MAG: RNA polymerase sigma-70 factor (ECF subfamily) [Saprospiraceae bacterium]|jgi:RNA polymerase sigma-70 factor (ECF subfamily)